MSLLAGALRQLRDVGVRAVDITDIQPEDLLLKVAASVVRAAAQTLVVPEAPTAAPEVLLRAAGCRYVSDAATGRGMWEASAGGSDAEVELTCEGRRYRLRSCVGWGQKGFVMRCWDVTEARAVALKLFYDADCAEGKRHFANEVCALKALLGTGATPELVAVGEALGTPCIVTNYMPGIPADSPALAGLLREAGTEKGAVLFIAYIEGLLQAFCTFDEAGVSCWDSAPRNVLFDPERQQTQVVDFGEASLFSPWRGSAPPSVPESAPQHSIVDHLEEDLGRHHNEHSLTLCLVAAAAQARAAEVLPSAVVSALDALLQNRGRATGRLDPFSGLPGQAMRLPEGAPGREEMARLSGNLSVAAVRSAWLRLWPGGVQQAQRVGRTAVARGALPNPDRETVYDSFEDTCPQGGLRSGNNPRREKELQSACDELSLLRMRCKAVTQRLSRRATATTDPK
eukprot:Hpha_TRINITY_DN16485_c2_g4::TRINITY_DN16485_c2_g4_i1::g.160437::m.160437